ncbi:MAG: glycosyltransferase [Lachnoclostridium sp.]|nr:glycosyltransferase [Lachnoclostridium sp.]
MFPGGKLTTDTYMNLFDAAIWQKYTGMKSWKILFHASGFGKVRLRTGNITVEELDIHCTEMEEKWIDFTYDSDNSRFCLDVEARDKMELSNIQIITNETEKAFTKVCIALNICTFHRQKALYHSLGVIRSSRFFHTNDSLYGKLQVYVVDNASEISIPKEEFISVYHNPNTGGSGGFTRGLVEIRKALPEIETTHVIFMDDDVEFIPETLYRIYALLSLIKEEYKDEVIAGRMFRMDDRKVQYTAAEIWNRGDIRHLGFNADMTQLDALKEVNDNAGAEYGGWWFCCFPMSFAKNNNPLPFFLHCDDVEYGLRHGGTPIILNGIQVWHETYEYRQTPVMAYYDCRNKLFVNKLYGQESSKKEILAEWKLMLSKVHEKKDYQTELMLIYALWDYGKGIQWLEKLDLEKHNQKMLKRKGKWIKNAIAWRVVWKKFR